MSKKKRITQKMIAQELGLTVTTVSKALKDYPDLNANTKKRIQDLARKWHYIPDSHSLALRNQQTQTIGLIVPEIVHFFFSNVIKGILHSAEEKGYQLIITVSRNDRKLEERQLELLYTQQVDGVLISISNETVDSNHFQLLKNQGVPIVMFDKVLQDFECKKVLIDDFKGGEMATQHLIDRGCQRIAHIRGPLAPSNAIGRYQGYLEALAKNNLPIKEEFVKVCSQVNYDEGYSFTQELLQMPNPPDGIFAITDQVGVGALRAAQDLGIKVPEDLKIIGFSNSQIGQVSNPPLSTIHQPGYEIGKTAARLLIDEISLAENSPQMDNLTENYILSTKLISRAST
ncbi:MAG: LacI family DNA-binding transcriptional regulator [Croceimicrobium sp.]